MEEQQNKIFEEIDAANGLSGAAQQYEMELARRLHVLQSVDIGRAVKCVMKSQGRSAIWLAKQLNMDRSNVYDLFHRRSIDVVLLMRISFVLDYDFLHDCSNIIGLGNNNNQKSEKDKS